MDAQERKTRIGDRIDQVPHEVTPRGNNLVVLAAKRNNSQRALIPCKSHDAIAVESGTVNDPRGFDGASSCFEHNFTGAFCNPPDFAIDQQLAAALLNQLGILQGNSRIIGDAGSGHVKRSDAGAVRLHFA